MLNDETGMIRYFYHQPYIAKLKKDKCNFINSHLNEVEEKLISSNSKGFLARAAGASLLLLPDLLLSASIGMLK